MPLTTCQVCERRFKDDRVDCPYCGALAASQILPNSMLGRWGAAHSRIEKSMIVVVLLIALNVWRGVTSDAGPDPEVEALHSEEAAVLVCREALESQLAAQDPSIVGPGRSEYLQGGEYEVRLVVEFQHGALRTMDEFLCQVQFTAETGWIVEEVSLDPS